MKHIITRGFCYTRTSELFPRPSEITIRTETTGNFSTISFAQDDDGIMLQVPVTKELKKLLKGVIE
jgi:hypothetical protein